MKPAVTLLENILLFLPVNYAVCLVCSTLRRKDMQTAFRQGTRLFIGMTIAVIAGCAALYFVMEFILAR